MGDIHKQKRIILSNMKETYWHFKEKSPHLKIRFSKFAELRLKHCILPGANGTHTVCVCVYHENVRVKLMFDGGGFAKLTYDVGALKDCRYYLTKVIFDTPRADCYFKKCDKCPEIERLKMLQEKFEERMIDRVTYRQWIHVELFKYIMIRLRLPRSSMSGTKTYKT